jgi:hypothetical protein
VGFYTNVTARYNNVSLELGLLNSSECKELAAHLREVADDLSPKEADIDQPTLAKDALEQLNEIGIGFAVTYGGHLIDNHIRAALERLQQLEQEGHG